LVVRAANDTLGAGTLKITRGPHNNGWQQFWRSLKDWPDGAG